MLIGFGYLMTFLKDHGFGSVGFNMLICALVIQWAMVCLPIVANIFHEHPALANIQLDTKWLIEGDFAAACVLITFGGLLGKVGPQQLLLIALIEVVIYAINYEIVAVKIGMLDV